MENKPGSSFLKPDRHISHPEQLVALLIILIVLITSAIFMNDYFLEFKADLVLQACVVISATGLLFSKRPAYLALQMLVWSYLIRACFISIILIVSIDTSAGKWILFLLAVIAVLIFLLLFFGSGLLRKKYGYDRKMRQITVASGVLISLIMQWLMLLSAASYPD